MTTKTNGIRTATDKKDLIVVRDNNKWVQAYATFDDIANRFIRWTMVLRDLNTGKEYYGFAGN